MMEIKVGLATCGIAAGGEAVFAEFKKEISQEQLNVRIKETGCIGMCYDEVLVEVTDSTGSYFYAKITPEKARRIVREHIMDCKPITEWIIKGHGCHHADTFLDKQKRIVLRNCGVIDPNSIDEYMAHDGYKAIQKCLKEYSQVEIIDIITSLGYGAGAAAVSPPV